MAKNYVMVIDEGTTGTRSLIFDKSLNIIASSYTEFTQYTPASDKVEHDAMEIYVMGDQILLTKVEERCVFCQGTTDLMEFQGKKVCARCRVDLQNPPAQQEADEREAG